MVELALSLEPVFPSAVAFVLEGPSVRNRTDAVLFHLQHGNLIQTQPESVIRLLNWLLTKCHEDWMQCEEVRKTILQLPKKKSFVDGLMTLCDELAHRGYPKPIELKVEIQKAFVEE